MNDPQEFKERLRVTPHQFDELLSRIEDKIRKKDTKLRPAISASRRLLLTLKYLASGSDFKSLSEAFRISTSQVGQIIPEVRTKS